MASVDQKYTPDEVVRRGEALYRERLRAEVENEANLGKYIAIDIETGAYEIGEDHYATVKRALAKRADAVLCGLRIGHTATGRIGGGLRTART